MLPYDAVGEISLAHCMSTQWSSLNTLVPYSHSSGVGLRRLEPQVTVEQRAWRAFEDNDSKHSKGSDVDECQYPLRMTER